MLVYVLHHEHELPSGTDDAKLIGVYASIADAEAARARAAVLPGFVRYPDGFTIDPYELGKDHWTQGFVTVWFDESGNEQVE